MIFPEGIWYVAAAAVASVPSYLALRSTRGVRKDIATNHGKRPGEYLEMVHDVRTDVAVLKQAFHDHAEQDERNFDEIKRHMDRRGRWLP